MTLPITGKLSLDMVRDQFYQPTYTGGKGVDLTLANTLSSMSPGYLAISGSGKHQYLNKGTGAPFNLLRSEDHGNTFVDGAEIPQDIQDVCCSADGRVAYFLPADPSVVYKSEDYGVTITNIAGVSGFGGSYQRKVVCDTTGNKLAVYDLTAICLFIKDGGNDWVKAAGQISDVLDITANADLSRILAIDSSDRLWETIDLGATWNNLGAIDVAALDPTGISCNDAGDIIYVKDTWTRSIWRSEDSGATWIDLGQKTDDGNPWAAIATNDNGHDLYALDNHKNLFKSLAVIDIPEGMSPNSLDNYYSAKPQGQLVADGLKLNNTGLTARSFRNKAFSVKMRVIVGGDSAEHGIFDCIQRTSNTPGTDATGVWQLFTKSSNNTDMWLRLVDASGKLISLTALANFRTGDWQDIEIRYSGGTTGKIEILNNGVVVHSHDCIDGFGSDTDSQAQLGGAYELLTAASSSMSTYDYISVEIEGEITHRWDFDGNLINSVNGVELWVLLGNHSFTLTDGVGMVPTGTMRNWPDDLDGRGVNAEIPQTGKLSLVDFYGAPWTAPYIPVPLDPWVYEEISSTTDNGLSNISALAMNSDGSLTYALSSTDDTLAVSTDMGLTFTVLEPTFSVDGSWVSVVGVCCSPDGQIIYVSDNSRDVLFVSSDGGLNFEVCNPSLPSNGLQIACSADGSIVYLTEYSQYVCKSTDHGATFERISSQVTDIKDICCSDDGMVFHALGKQVMKSSFDGGVTWVTGGVKFDATTVSCVSDGQIVYHTHNTNGIILRSLDGHVSYEENPLSLTATSMACGTSRDGKCSIFVSGGTRVWRSAEEGLAPPPPARMFLTHREELVGTQGQRITLSADGNVGLLSSENGQQLTYLYIQDNGDVYVGNTITNTTENEYFGNHCAINADGTMAVVGIRGANAIQQVMIADYEITLGERYTQADAPYFGTEVSISDDGDLVLVSRDYGSAGGAWTIKNFLTTPTLADTIVLNGEGFGRASALSADGRVAVVGCINEDAGGSNAGAVYCIAIDADGMMTLGNFITGSLSNQNLGHELVLSGDGSRGIAGSRPVASSNHPTYAFSIENNVITTTSILNAEGTWNWWHHAMAGNYDGTMFVVSASRESTGTVRVLSLIDGDLAYVDSVSYVPPTGADFGTSLALNRSGSRLVAVDPLYGEASLDVITISSSCIPSL